MSAATLAPVLARYRKHLGDLDHPATLNFFRFRLTTVGIFGRVLSD